MGVIASDDNFDPNEAAKAFLSGQSVASKSPRTTLDVPGVVDDELDKLGYPEQSRLAILGNLGRENNWKSDIIFGGHSDPKNQAANRGLMSWQGDRRTNLENFINKNGGNWEPTENNLRLQTQFLDNELKSKYPGVHKVVNDPNADLPTVSRQLRNYINYVPDAPYNTRDPEYDVVNNRKWAEKALARGLGTFNPNNAAQRFLDDHFDPNQAAQEFLGTEGHSTPPVRSSDKPLMAPGDIQAPEHPAEQVDTVPQQRIIEDAQPIDLNIEPERPDTRVGMADISQLGQNTGAKSQKPIGKKPKTHALGPSPTENVSVSIDPNDFTIDGEKVTDIAPANTVETPREIGKPTDDLNRVAKVVRSDRTDPREAAIDSLVQAGYDITPDEAAKYVDSLPNPLASKDYQPGDGIQVTLKNIADIKGQDKATEIIRTEQAEAAPGLVTPKDLHVGRNFTEDDAKSLNETLGPRLGADIGSLLAFGGKTSEHLAGIIRLLDLVNPVSRSIGEIVPGEQRDSVYDFLKGANDSTQSLLKEVGSKKLTYDEDGRPVISDDLATSIEKKATEITGDLSRVYLMGTLLPGASSIAGKVAKGATLFGSLSALETAGSGADVAEIKKQTLKGASIGALFGIASPLGDVASDIIGTVANKAIPNLVKEGLTLGTIAGGTFTIAKIAGDSNTQAMQEALVNSLFHAAPIVLGKTVEFAGSKIKVHVDEDGKITTVPQDAKADVTVKPQDIPGFDKVLKPLTDKEANDLSRDLGAPPRVEQNKGETEAKIKESTAGVEKETVKETLPSNKEAEQASATKEPWQTNRENYLANERKDILTDNPNTPEGDVKGYLNKADNDWRESVEQKALTGEQLPQDVLDAYYNAYGNTAFRQTFRGQAEQKGYVFPDTIQTEEITPKAESAHELWQKPWKLAKQRFQLERKQTVKEWQDNKAIHKKAVAKALREGKTVPPEVLADYPDLVRNGAKPPTQSQLKRQELQARKAANEAKLAARRVASPIARKTAEFIEKVGRQPDEGEQLGLATKMTADEVITHQKSTPPEKETEPTEAKPTKAPEAKPELAPDLKPFANNKIITADKVAADLEYGAKNKIVTADRAQKARELLAKKLGEASRTASIGGHIDPAILKAMAEIGAFHVEAGARTFAQFALKMRDEIPEHLKELGEDAHKLLKQLYTMVRKEHNFEGMEDIPREFTPEPKGEPSSIKHAEINADNERRGWPKLAKRIKQSNPDLHKEVQDIIAQDPTAPLKTFEKYKEHPKAVPNTAEGVLLNKQIIDMRAEYDTAAKRSIETMGSDDPLVVADAKMGLKVAEAKLKEAKEVAFRGGSERGAALQSQKMFADEDFEFTKLVQDFQIAKGREPSTPELKELQAIANEHKAKSEALELALAGKDREIADIQAQMPPRHILDIAEGYVNKLHDLAEKERTRLKARGNVFQAGIDPRDLKSAAIIGADHLANMTLDFAKFSDKMIEEFGDKVKPHLDKLFEEAQQVLKGGHAALKSDADTMSRTLKAHKTRMENRIKELENAIAKRERITRIRKSITPDSELESLRDKAKSLKEDYDAIFPREPRPQMTDAQRLQALEKRLEKKQKTIQDKVDSGDFSENEKRVPLDPMQVRQDTSGKYTAEDKARATRIVAAQAEVGKIEKRYAKLKSQAERKNEPAGKWFQRKLTNYVRGSMLSAITVIEKLGAASIGRTVTRPVRTGIGTVVSKIIPGIARRAPIEGSKGLWNDVKNEGHALAKAYTTGIMDIGRTITGRGSDISNAFGQKENYLSSGKYLPFEASQLIGLMHDSLKAPAFRSEYEGVLGNLIMDAKRNGQPIDPETMFVLGQKAYQYAQRAKFAEKRWASDEISKVIRKLDNNELTPVQAIGTFLHIVMPIHKISTNVIAQSLESSPLGLGKGVAKAISAKVKGLDNLTDEQGDIIMRNIKNGAFGTAMYAIGLFAGGKVIGSFYQKYDKDKDKNVAKYNTIQIDGVRIPAALLHLPEFNALFMGATTKRIYEETLKANHKDGSKATPSEAAIRGAGGGVGSLIEETPGIEAAGELTNIYHAVVGGDEEQMTESRYGIGNFVSGRVVPGIVRNAAEAADQDPEGHYTTPFTKEPYHRKINSKTFGQSVTTQIQKNIPGWRNRLPNDTPK